jgi:F-type H+-transporting ATPase subunit epsilon
MKLSIISLKKIEYEGEAVSINIKTTSGEITVLDNHRPLITALTSGRAFVTKKDDDNKLEFNIVSGFLEVGENNEASLLIS